MRLLTILFITLLSLSVVSLFSQQSTKIEPKSTSNPTNETNLEASKEETNNQSEEPKMKEEVTPKVLELKDPPALNMSYRTSSENWDMINLGHKIKLSYTNNGDGSSTFDLSTIDGLASHVGNGNIINFWLYYNALNEGYAPLQSHYFMNMSNNLTIYSNINNGSSTTSTTGNVNSNDSYKVTLSRDIGYVDNLANWKMVTLSIYYKSFIYYYKGLNDNSGELELVGYVDNSGNYGDTNLNTAYKPTGYKNLSSNNKSSDEGM